MSWALSTAILQKNQIEDNEVFVRRVCHEKEKKLKEFNF